MTGPGPLDEIGESVGNALLSQAGRLSSRYHERRGLEADVLESDDAYLVVFDAPGATSSDLQVRYLDGQVLVRLDRFREFHEGFEMRFPGRGLSLDGEIALPDDAVVDATAARATLADNGTLQIELPKTGTRGVDRAGTTVETGPGTGELEDEPDAGGIEETADDTEDDGGEDLADDTEDGEGGTEDTDGEEGTDEDDADGGSEADESDDTGSDDADDEE